MWAPKIDEVRLHVKCFYVWTAEQADVDGSANRANDAPPSPGRLPVMLLYPVRPLNLEEMDTDFTGRASGEAGRDRSTQVVESYPLALARSRAVLVSGSEFSMDAASGGQPARGNDGAILAHGVIVGPLKEAHPDRIVLADDRTFFLRDGMECKHPFGTSLHVVYSEQDGRREVKSITRSSGL